MNLMFASLLRRYRSSDGTVEPKPHGGGQLAKINSDLVAMIVTFVEKDNDAILVELC